MFAQLGRSAEQVFSGDPNTTLIKLRQLGEALAQDLAARSGIVFDSETTQADLRYKLQREIQLDPEIHSLFHTLRIEGNKAAHQFQTRHKDAMDGLKVAPSLAIDSALLARIQSLVGQVEVDLDAPLSADEE